MRLRFIPLAAIAIAAGFVLWQRAPRSFFSQEAVTGRQKVPVGRIESSGLSGARAEATKADAIAERASRRRDQLTRLAYAQEWETAPEPALAGFRAWVGRYQAAPIAERAALEEEGLALARARRAAMRTLIQQDPQHALAVTVPMAVRATLPAAILRELETRVSGRGEYALLARSPGAEIAPRTPTLRRVALLGGVSYTAYVYGRREPQTSLPGSSLHGIVIDRDLALHESPLRVLEPGEVPAAAADANCPVSDLPVKPLPADLAVNTADLSVAEVEGRIVEFCNPSDGMIATYEATLLARESGAGGIGSAPDRAAEPSTAWTTGTKQVLVIRVDFSDVPGEPMTQAAALGVMNNGVKTFFEEMSFGQTSINATVSDAVYRLPQTASAYAVADNETQLHTDARTAASAQYTMASYDRIIVLFANLGTSRIPGSRITFGGEAQVIGANVWINGSGSFTTATVSHELGHTYGLLHGNLWRINDGNPISPAGNSLEYGDPFETMGSSTVTGVTRDTRHHFNHWHKNRLGWMPDSAVTTVTTSGTYRVHRFDSKDAPANQPMALRIFRDGVRWYWVGLRQNFSSGSPQANGAHIIWGFNQRQQSQLLDLVTPGSNANDATLPLGTTFSDPTYGVTIKPIARGGTEPSQYLDVEVTISSPSGIVAGWGREGSYFFDGNTGAPPAVAPETNVPMGTTGIRAIAAGDQHVVALRANGSVIAWGDHVNGQTTIPGDVGDVLSVHAGGDVSGVVRRDGTVRLWGLGTSGVTTPPAGLNTVTGLAIGRNHALALKADGTVVAWGANTLGQTTIPSGLTDVVAVAAGTEFSLALKRDGTVVSWGSTFGRPPAGLTGVTAIAACGVLNGGQFAAGLKSDGTVVAWGANNSSQTNVPADLNGVAAIAVGAFHGLALKSDGTVVQWGTTTFGTAPRDMPRSWAITASSQGSFSLVGSSITITSQPFDTALSSGGSATLSVGAASGVGGLTYQWRKDGAPIAGATGSTFLALAEGTYDVVLRDAFTSVTSTAARVIVAAAGPEVSRISNLSIRTSAGTGAQTLIVGFVVGGASGSKPLLVRGVGPALASFGVTNALTDPKVEVYAGSVRMLENDNWNAGDAPVFTQVGAFALPPNSRDAALFNGALASGGYSAQLSGVNGATGVVLAEIYDATPSSVFRANTPRLVNVSARAVSGAGANILIAGFTIAGPTAKTVLLRAIGPTLAVFGVTGVLNDPRLELYNSGSVSIAQNDNWGGTPALDTAFKSVGAFGLDGTSRDAALLVTLNPGSYTAQVSGNGGATGVALVEVYEVP